MADALKEAVAFMERAGAMLGRGEMPSPTSLYAVKWHAAHATILAALSAAEARERVKDEQIAKLRAAINWLDEPFIDKLTTADELRSRIGFMMADRDRALTPETPHAE